MFTFMKCGFCQDPVMNGWSKTSLNPDVLLRSAKIITIN
ncbi:hypothetical protein MC7420_3971 [Coleofasciculus chthonoplastes PCC 7420]|uniref:Uncharacterized protein n=1 Tax=Coleofasciculus chthonoplastes PCC 7420 TaxID=118168 RepID=B4VUC0_9CYAN|nr:hypothetical protein MC7420_3971 [Coleofasciculus chthonoplastes PCC 7420]